MSALTAFGTTKTTGSAAQMLGGELPLPLHPVAVQAAARTLAAMATAVEVSIQSLSPP